MSAQWDSLLAGKTITNVETRELDVQGDGEHVAQVIAFYCSDGSVVLGLADGGDLEGQYATFEPIKSQCFDDVTAEHYFDNALWLDANWRDAYR